MTLDPRAFKGLSRFLAPASGGPLADRALSEKLITSDQLQECIDEQDRTGRALDELLVERGYLKAADVERLREPALPPEVAEAIREPVRHVSQYVLVSLLGRGGMGEVWKAWDRSLGRWVAIKFLRPDVGHPTQRIEREGRMAGGLSHPNIVSIFERGHHNGRPYLVMPFVEGTAPGAPMSPRKAARVAREVALALAHAHSKGVIHRDVKPANIILDGSGRVHLTDFGLAIPGESQTWRWAMSGTPEYASPEQVRGDSLDARTDIYSLGATLYHLLSGRPPFSGKDPEEIAGQVLSAEVPAPRGTPSALAAIVRKAMNRDPAMRYATAVEFADGLHRFAEPKTFAVLKRPASILAMVLAAILSGGLTYVGLELNRTRQEREEVVEVLRGGNRALSQAEQIRIDPESDQERVASAARQAVPHFQTAVRMTEGQDPEAHAGLGRCYELMGQAARAEGVYREALETEAGRRGLARIHLRRHLEGNRLADWRESAFAHLDRKNAEPWYAAGQGAWDRVLKTGPRMLEEYPYDEMTHLVMGIAALELGKLDDAASRLASAVRLCRWDPVARYHKGRAHGARGEKKDAARELAEALRLASPASPLRRLILHDINQLD